MMKAMGGGPKRGPMAQMAQMFGMGGGMPSPEEIAELQKKMGGGAGGLPKEPPALTAPPPASAKPSLPGLGASKPLLPGLGGLSGLNPFKKK